MGPGKDTLGTPVPTQWGGRRWHASAAQTTCTPLRAGHTQKRYTANIFSVVKVLFFSDKMFEVFF